MLFDSCVSVKASTDIISTLFIIEGWSCASWDSKTVITVRGYVSHVKFDQDTPRAKLSPNADHKKAK